MRRTTSIALGLLMWLSLALTQCATHPERRAAEAPRVVLHDEPRRAGFRAISVLLTPSVATRQVWQGIRDGLSGEFDLVTQPIDSATTAEDVASELAGVRPSCVVLIGNHTVNLYHKYQQQHAGPFPPAVVVMASFLDAQLPLVKNATGVVYEIPGITTFVNLRSLMRRPIDRVGVVRRAVFSGYLNRQRKLARLEKVEIVDAVVDDHPTAEQITSALERLIVRDKVDAIWVLNDNALLKPKLIPSWLGVLHEHPMAVVVGASTLVDARVHFGSFAMLPDHTALGAQAADLILRLADEDWDVKKEPVELPISIETVMDLPWMKEHFELREGALDGVDRIVQ